MFQHRNHVVIQCLIVAFVWMDIRTADAWYVVQLPPDHLSKANPSPSNVSDEYLVSLFWDVVLTLRAPVEGIQSIDLEALAKGSLSTEEAQKAREILLQTVHVRAEFLSRRKSTQDATYLINATHSALDDNPVDWNKYRVAIWAMKAGMQGDTRVVELTRKALRMPRGEKISDAQGYAILETLALLGFLDCKEAIDFLLECTTAEFWGPDPIRSRVIRSPTTAEGIRILRYKALEAISRARGELSLPALEELWYVYTDYGTEPWGDENIPFEWGARRIIEEHIEEVYQRNGEQAIMPIP